MSHLVTGLPDTPAACSTTDSWCTAPPQPGVQSRLMAHIRRAPAVLAIILASLAASPVWAVHDDNLFELDQPTTCTVKVNGQDTTVNCGAANVADSPAGSPDDWANVYGGNDHAFARAFVDDPTGSAETSFYTGGGSKDEEAIDTSLGANKSWQYDNANDVVPDKDDIAHAFAAAYKAADDHIIFYFGADRFDTSGDAEMGFWFFRNPISLGVKPAFVGVHAVGDILVLVDFVGGGDVGNITIYKVSAVSATGVPTMTLVADKSGADCSLVGAGDQACGVINNIAGETPPWGYTNKDGQHSYQKAALFEAGIDLTALGLDLGCFSTFMAETRSSHSLSAELKDFAMGQFNVCGLAVAKTGDTLSKVSDPVDYSITITNTGIQTLYKQAISDSVLGAITVNGVDQSNSYVIGNTCGASLAGGASCVVTLRRTVQAGDPDPLPNTATATYREKSNLTGTSLTETSGHEVNLFQPSITLTKTADPTAILQGDTVNYKITLTNTSSSDTPNLDCTITDAMLGITYPAQGTVSLVANDKVELTPQFLFNNPSALSWCKAGLVGVECTNTAVATCSPAGWPNVLSKQASAKVVVTLATVDVTVQKSGPQYAKVGDTATYTFKVTSGSNVPTTVTSLTDTVLGDLLDDMKAVTGCGTDQLTAAGTPGDSCTFTASRAIQAGDPDPLNNTVTVVLLDAFSNTATATASHAVDLVHPAYTVSKSCVNDPVPAGASANFDIKVMNTGDIPLVLGLSDPATGINLSGISLGKVVNNNCVYDNNAADGCYLAQGSMIATGTSVSNTVDATATLPAQYGLPNVINHSASSSCTVQQGGATRTPGFWQTHGFTDGYTCHVFEEHLAGSISLGWRNLEECSDVMGIFWASPAKTSNGTKRSQLCQATELASFQLLAAILNSALDNGKSLPIDPKSGLDIVKAEQQALTYCYDNNSSTVCDRNNILRLKDLLGTYNGSGDNTAIIDTDGTVVNHADPRASRQGAYIPVADCN
ncbi:hypothetical protein ACFOLG_01265 [Vogesella facilis]|uniref:Ig-like domain-containing protein n=1 Tax=Vogesella facilis TaxID=1655232 RepID=A0ABV7R9S9_9NEIS